jgi:hypothetical protein
MLDERFRMTKGRRKVPFQSAESAIEFDRRSQRHQIAGLERDRKLSRPVLGLLLSGVDGNGLYPLRGTERGCCGSWTNDGNYFIFSGPGVHHYNLWAIPERTGVLSHNPGLPVPLTNGPLSYSPPLPSRDGKTIYAVGFQDRGELIRYDSSSKQFVTNHPRWHLCDRRDVLTRWKLANLSLISKSRFVAFAG